MLHIITRSPFSSSALADCVKFAKPQSSLLLLGGGVYALAHPLLANTINHKIYVISEDAEARGIAQRNDVEYISYSKMVALTEEHHPIQTWS